MMSVRDRKHRHLRMNPSIRKRQISSIFITITKLRNTHDVDSDYEFDTVEENIRTIKDFADKTLAFLENERALRQEERQLQNKLSYAAEKSALSAANLRAKGIFRELRSCQIAKRFSSNTKDINEAAAKSLEEYNAAAKNYMQRQEVEPPIKSVQLKQALFKTIFVQLKKKRKQDLRPFETAYELNQIDILEKLIN